MKLNQLIYKPIVQNMPIKYLTLLLVLCCASFGLYAQETPQPPYWELSAGDTAMVFADKAYIRDLPGMNGTTVVDSLSAGMTVKIMSEVPETSTVRGFNANWYQVRYHKDGQSQQGYIWLGMLALRQTRIDNGKTVLYGFERYTPAVNNKSAFYTCGLKLLDEQRNVLAQQTFAFDYSEQSYTEIKGLTGMGLKGLRNIVRIGFLGEACAIPSNFYYFGWNGSRFIPLPEAYRVSDAGVYYYTEQMLFPSEHKKDANFIYKMIEEGEALDEDNGKEIRYKTRKKKVTYLWDGKGYVKKK